MNFKSLKTTNLTYCFKWFLMRKKGRTKSMKKILCAFFPLLLSIEYSFGQHDSNTVSVGIMAGAQAYSPSEHIQTGGYYGITAGLQINMANNYNQLVGMLDVQDINVEANYINMHEILFKNVSHSKGILGNLYGITSSLDIVPFRTRPVAFIVSPGVGIEIAGQDFHTNGNPVIGSPVNFVAKCGLGAELRLSSSLKVRLLLSPLHISDGGTESPNAGENMIPFSFTLLKDIDYSGPTTMPADEFPANSKNFFEFDVGVSWRGYEQTGYYYNQQHVGMYLTDQMRAQEGVSDLYQLHLHAAYKYRLNPIFGFNAGTDITGYTHPFKDDTEENFFKTYEEWASSYIPLWIGVSAGGDLYLARLVLSVDYGYFVYAKFLDSSIHTYWTTGLSYWFTQSVGVGAKIYYHGTQSAFTSVTVNFSFQ